VLEKSVELEGVIQDISGAIISGLLIPRLVPRLETSVCYRSHLGVQSFCKNDMMGEARWFNESVV
jgi:hypothetical protein